MKYCILGSARGNEIDYHEFQVGKWDGKTFWKYDSLLLKDTIFKEYELDKKIAAVMGSYALYDIVTLTRNQWEQIFDPEENELIKEIDEWAQINFTLGARYISILGI